jgi:hypothetical protein
MDEKEVFQGKSLPDLLKDIHDNAVEKRTKIGSIITQLVGFITSSDEARMIAPLIKDFYDVGVKNDEQVVKVATIAQRVIASEQEASSGDSGFLLSDFEKDRLIQNVQQATVEIDYTIKALVDETKS